MGTDNAKAWDDFIRFENEDAFHVLYTHYFKYLTYIGLKKGFPSTRVKDEINELFLYLWECRNKLKTIGNFHNYIITAYLRKLYRKDDIPYDVIADGEARAELLILPSVESQYIHLQGQRDISRILTDFVGKLPERQRQMIYQKFYLGLSYKEISEANNVSINTVYNTIYKAVEKLKKLIGKDNPDSLLLFLILLCILFLFFLAKQ
jgi:RNA polymerase sigma factor (sigma-70 family)